ncbi:BT1A1 protein, partial [Amia calva]|nr:BT1A1 protein [Amia calva]
FKVIGTSEPVVAAAGEAVVLPCHVSPSISVEDFEIRWYRENFAAPVYLFMDHRLSLENQILSYKGRAAFLLEDLRKGNVSLRLNDVRGSDEGRYTCFVRSKLWFGETAIQLTVRASGTLPVISIEGHQEGGIGLVCESKGWYPEPALVWMDSEGQSLTAGRTETVRDSRDLFTVRGQVIIQERDINRYTCSVTQQQLNEGKDTKMYIPSELFPRVSPWMKAFFVFFTFFLIALNVGVFFYFKLRREKGKEEDKLVNAFLLRADPSLSVMGADSPLRAVMSVIIAVCCWCDLWFSVTGLTSLCLTETLSQDKGTLASDRIDLTLDPSTAHPWLCVSSDGKQVSLGDKQKDISKHPQRSDSVYSVMSNESFGKGKRYWEVHVGEKTEWTLGVAKRVNYFFGSYKNCSVCCSVGKNKNGLIASSSSDNILQSLEPRKVGVFLDYEGGQVSFYSVGERAHICTCTIDTNRDDLYPYFSPGDSEDGTNAAPLIINPVGYGDK